MLAKPSDQTAKERDLPVRLSCLVGGGPPSSDIASSGQSIRFRNSSPVNAGEIDKPAPEMTDVVHLRELERITSLYETLLSTTSDFAYIFDPQGRFVYANASLLKIYARTLDQVVGKTFHELGYPTWHADMHMREIQGIVQNKQSFRGEIPFTGNSGIYGVYDYIFQPVLDASGNVEFIVGTTRDVTARKQAEGKHHRSQSQAEFLSHLTQKLSTVSDSTELNQIAVRAIGEYLKVHRCYFFNAYPDIHHARTWPDWCNEEGQGLEGIYALAQYGTPEWWAAVRTGPVSVDDIRTHALTKDFLPNYQALKIASYSLCPFIHEGQWKACISVTSDVPRIWTADEKSLLENAAARVWPLLERAQIEETLRKSEEALSRIAAVVEYSEDAIISKSLDGIIMSWNAGAQRIFGYTADEIIGKSILALIPPELHKEEPGIIERLKKGLRIEHYETIRVAKGGRKVAISLTVSPIKDKSGKIIGASKIARDITEEKRRQETQRESEARFRIELERLVGERTASLQEAVSQMEEFSYSVSHDLRAPLRAMQGYASALLEDYQGKLDDQGQEYLRHIASAGQRMDRLTRDVLVYSKIPRTAFQTHAVDLNMLVSDIVRQNLPDQSKTTSVTIEKPLLPVLGNDSFLAQSISNLIDNAVKFASKNRPLQIHIRTEPHQNQVRLVVEDNGIGILPEHQSRVWGMFERIHPQHLYEGTGIGLAIVRKTVERMNGTMGVVSDGATGSTFWIELPGVTA
jgi:PAS domain S-box-containing protein